MEPDNRGTKQQASPLIPQSSGYSNYGVEQARRAGYTGLETSHTEHFRDGLFPHHNPLHPHPFPHPSPHHALPFPHPSPHHAPYPQDMRESILRELEKQRIREEIILSEIARRRMLEEEVRKELMMERELALKKGSDSFLYGSSSTMAFDPRMRLPSSSIGVEGMSLEGRMALSIEERERLNLSHGSKGFDNLPFQRSADMRISEVKPALEEKKEKEKLILLAKPDASTSGSKRKAVTLPGVETTKLPAAGLSTKKAKHEWNCAICEVSATSEQGLKEHLQGKKHKAKENTHKSQRGGKNYSIGLIPKDATKSIEVVGTINPGKESGAKIAVESIPPTNSKKENLPALLQKQKSDDLIKKSPEVVQNVQNNVPKKWKFKFWCEQCQVGAFSRKVMNTHQKGKKHIRRLGESNRNSKASEDVDEASNKVSSENAKKPEEPVDETKAENGGILDVTEGQPVDQTKEKEDDSGAVEITIQENDSTNDKVLMYLAKEDIENEKNTFMENVDQASDEVKLEDHKPMDVVNSKELEMTRPVISSSPKMIMN